MKILAVDPGESIGYVVLTYDLTTKQMTILATGIQKLGDNSRVTARFFRAQADGADVFVVENYVVNPRVSGYDHQGDKGVALRQIGMLEMLAVEKEVAIVLQMPTSKPAGYGFLGKKYVKGKKEQHSWDALAHAAFYLVSKQGMQPIGP